MNISGLVERFRHERELRFLHEGRVWFCDGWTFISHVRKAPTLEVRIARLRDLTDEPCKECRSGYRVRSFHEGYYYPDFRFRCTCLIRDKLFADVDTNFIEIEKGLFTMDRKVWHLINGTAVVANAYESERAAVETAKDLIRQGRYTSLIVVEALSIVSRSDIVVTTLK